MNIFHARYAKNLSERSLHGIVIDPFLKEAFAGIKSCAENGKTIWYVNFKVSTSSDVRDAVYNRLRELGYAIEYHDDPDPGHPCSSGTYETVEW